MGNTITEGKHILTCNAEYSKKNQSVDLSVCRQKPKKCDTMRTQKVY